MSTIIDGRGQLGAALRRERTRRGLSLTELAELSGVSRAMISRIERDESSPTAVVLGKLSGALEVSISTLLQGDTPSEPGATGGVRPAAETPDWRDPDTGYLRRQISTPGFPADVTEVELPPGAHVPYPARAFAFVAQLVWVIAGELTLVEGDETSTLGPGDTVELGAPARREFGNDTSAACRYLVVLVRRASP